MTFDLAKILQSKRAFRQRLAARPIEEKLAMLDALRARALPCAHPGLRRARERCMKPPPYGCNPGSPDENCL